MVGTHPLQVYRASRQLSQEQLGRELGVSGVTVSRWENKTRFIGPKILPFVSAKTGIPAKELRPDLAEALEAAE